MGDWQITVFASALVFSLVAAVAGQRNDELAVPAGAFTMGTDESRVDALMARFSSKRRELFASELPAHRATVRAFSIDRTEVTPDDWQTGRSADWKITKSFL